MLISPLPGGLLVFLSDFGEVPPFESWLFRAVNELNATVAALTLGKSCFAACWELQTVVGNTADGARPQRCPVCCAF